MMLRRHEDVGLRHGRHADVMDHRRAAVSDIGALDDGAQLAFVQSRPAFRHQRAQPGIGQRRAYAQPVDLLFRLDHAQPHVFGVEPRYLEPRFELFVFGRRQRPHDAYAFCAAALQFLYGFGDAPVFTPAHIDAFGQFFSQREMVVPFHVHQHLLAGPENHVGLDRTRPAGHPLRRVAAAVVGDHQQVVAAVFFHHGRQRGVAARIFGIGKTRVFLLHDGEQPRPDIQRIVCGIHSPIPFICASP
jgi:hypothetical protein